MEGVCFSLQKGREVLKLLVLTWLVMAISNAVNKMKRKQGTVLVNPAM